MPDKAMVWTPAELRVGQGAEFQRDVTEADVQQFACNSGDHNPLHVDETYSAQTRFGRRIVHGAFQVGLASALVGMYLPGQNALLGSISARFPSPLFFPSRVTVRGEITAWNREALAGQLRIVVVESAGIPTAEISAAFTFHESTDTPSPTVDATMQPAPVAIVADRPVVIVTGASGAVGSAIVANLAQDYTVVAMVNRRPLDGTLRSLPNVREVHADFTSPTWEEEAQPILKQESLFGVVHTAWPGAPHGGLLQSTDEVIRQQTNFGTIHTVRLARLLYSRVGSIGGRFIAISSIVGNQRPSLNLAAYSLGKAALETTVRLLAPELARKQVTINAICPSFMPVGINKQFNERQLKLEAARVPLGRLCMPEDVAGAVRYLLSPTAAFVSGQVLGITGAQL